MNVRESLFVQNACFPQLFRPPYGVTNHSINRLARRMGLLPILWSVDAKDWQRPPANEVVSRVLAGAHPGAMIHDDGGGERSPTIAVRTPRRRLLVT